MKKKDIPETVCAFCELGIRMADGETVLCKKKGPVSADYSCRKFIFDPLKESPTPVSTSFKKAKFETL